jgi:hypothetical protein
VAAKAVAARAVEGRAVEGDKLVEVADKLAVAELKEEAQRADKLAVRETRGLEILDGTRTMSRAEDSRINLEIRTGLSSFSSRQ